MANKKTPIYFWLKLDNNFYKNLAIKKARKMPGGDTMIVIYQKMMLSSLDTNGTLFYEGTFESLEEELALMLDETVEQTSMTLAYFIKAGLIQIDDNQDIEMLQVPALIQQETNWARYKREQRNAKKLDNVQQLSNACPTEIEKEIDIELEKELETDTPYRRLVAVYESNGFGTISSITSQKLNDELKDFTEKNNDVNESVEVIKKAFEIAVLNGANNLNYVLSITKRWYQANLFTLKDIEAAELKRSNQKSQRSGKSSYKREGITPKFMQGKATPVPEPTVNNEDLPEWMQDL